MNKDLCPICRLNIVEAIGRINKEKAIIEEILTKIKMLITAKEDTMDELSRLYELNFCARRNAFKNKELDMKSILQRIPRKISNKQKTEVMHKLYTVGAVEYGIPVPVTLKRNYHTSIIQKHIHVLNDNLSNLYKTMQTNSQIPY